VAQRQRQQRDATEDQHPHHDASPPDPARQQLPAAEQGERARSRCNGCTPNARSCRTAPALLRDVGMGETRTTSSASRQARGAAGPAGWGWCHRPRTGRPRTRAWRPCRRPGVRAPHPLRPQVLPVLPSAIGLPFPVVLRILRHAMVLRDAAGGGLGRPHASESWRRPSTGRQPSSFIASGDSPVGKGRGVTGRGVTGRGVRGRGIPPPTQDWYLGNGLQRMHRDQNRHTSVP
jgi:hypothetical protein